MTSPTPLHFFAVVLRPRAPILAAAAGIVAFSVWLVYTNPEDLDQIPAMLLFFQMFASATGFRQQATRGHFDPLFTAGHSTARVVASHWLVSMGPGAAAWLIVTIVLAATRPSAWPPSLTPSALAGLLYVSSASWTIGALGGRYSAGVSWIAVLFVLSGLGHIDALRQQYIAGGLGLGGALGRSAAAAVCPVFLLTQPADLPSVAIVLLLGLLWTLAGAVWLARLDVPLRNPS